MSTCKGCGREIRWIKTPNEKAMPVDPPEIRFVAAEGPETYIAPDGKTLRGFEVVNVRYPFTLATRIGYRPHWGTCPAADHFNRGGGKE